ncbi:YihY/virulence factor BrkB family protein [Solwaraspora sp. WMMD406]|uniref:YihY/virulence factor BrkB family protein n=1 Tax=Solwaraspora sp. WMMD406 TaxID=3016095 RepID=UPI00241752DD|nr:YihY/virulence factor BrkB family protein [Solwaraspora sp. WMMD406]MDG4766610.1 YihY/virulence factor BrkB family protein [Solwaraspora sp. WMMD406]
MGSSETEGPAAGGRSAADVNETEPQRSLRLRDLRPATWRYVVVNSGREFVRDNCVDWAAALTYYGVLALFPSMIVIVALVGLVSDGERTVETIVDLADDVGAGGVVGNDAFIDVVNEVVNQRSSAGVLLSFGLLAALWSASGYVRAFTRAANAIYGVTEGRPFYKLQPQQLGLTSAGLVLLALVATMLIVSGPVADAVGDLLGLGQAPRTAWDLLKWPVLVAIMTLLLTLLFWLAPNVRQPRIRWLAVGGAVTLFLWAASSVGFGVYVAHFGSYDVTYGSLGAVIAFLVWLYLANLAVMLGVEINAEVQRGRAMQAGEPDPSDPVLPPRTPAR